MVPSDPRGGSRLHDFHPPISSSGLFWTIPAPADSCTIDADGRAATIDVQKVFVVDQPAFPDRVPTTPGTLLTMRVTWKATAERVRLNDPHKQFAVDAHRAEAHVAFSVEVPGVGFTWRSDPIETSSASFAIVGHEMNGRYYETRMPDVVGMGESQAKALLGNLSITNVVTEYEGHEALGNAFKHDLHSSVVTGTIPPVGEAVQADARVALQVRDKR